MLDRRKFLATTAAAGVVSTAISTSPAVQSQEEKKQVVVGIMGWSRGRDLASDLLNISGVSIKYACDIDKNRAESGAKLVSDKGGKAEAISDFRTILADPEVDVLVCAAPNHWHGPATIMGCKAGKHVYVEKPCSHNAAEGAWMVAAAEKYSRCVQVGNQRRSAPEIQQAIAKLHSGAIGKVYLARSFFNRLRGPIGNGKDAAPPPHLDYDLWQGPAPKLPYKDNVVHYNWHWFWHWGNGELGNNGVHSLDLCRWGLGVDYPVRTTSSGGKYMFTDDDQETPDTHLVGFEFEAGKQISYQGLSRTQTEPGPFVSFFGEEGYMELDADGSHRIFNRKNEKVEDVKGTGWGQSQHLQNFIDAVRANNPALLNQPVLSAHKSTLLCHLGNIAHRTGRTVVTSPKDGTIQGDAEQLALWRREYDPAWDALITTA